MIYYDPQWFYRSSIYYYFYRTIEQTSIVAESSMVLYTMIYYGWTTIYDPLWGSGWYLFVDQT